MTENNHKRFPLSVFKRRESRRKTPTFGALCRRAAHKIRAVQILCEEDTSDYPDAPALLYTAWKDLSDAVALHQPGSQDATFVSEAETTTNPSLFAANGYLTAVLGESFISRQSWLNEAADRYFKFAAANVSREQCDDALQALCSGLDNIRAWYRKKRSTLLTKLLQWATVGITALGMLALAGAFGYGVFEYHTRADDTNGLSATYFSQRNFLGHPFMWVDQQIDFDWTKTPPFKTSTMFSVRWEGCINVPDSARHLTVTSTETPFTVWVDEEEYLQQKRIVQKNKAPISKSNPTKRISKGTHPIVIEFSSMNRPATVSLRWKAANGRSAVVPAKSLIPLGGNSDYICHRQSVTTTTNQPHGGEAPAQNKNVPRIKADPAHRGPRRMQDPRRIQTTSRPLERRPPQAAPLTPEELRAKSVAPTQEKKR
ncbi:MAG: hypothetical protein JXX29_05760 [Deltaproteobacteria bacterium]|nr:hypothetical protein [Deltaproteobacteria bacterium]MBN2671155.1 hypothetical protein [Deltaproteobacteria bacterium]